MAEISDKDRKLLRKLFAKLGSDNVNERESTHAKMLEILHKYNKTWNDLTEELLQPVPSPQSPTDPDPRRE